MPDVPRKPPIDRSALDGAASLASDAPPASAYPQLKTQKCLDEFEKRDAPVWSFVPSKEGLKVRMLRDWFNVFDEVGASPVDERLNAD